MASSSSPSTTSMYPFPRTLLELTTDHTLLKGSVFHAICQTAEKPTGILSPLVSLVVDYLKVQREERPFGFFGEKEWTDHLGSVPPAPPLPSGIEGIWQGPCPIYPEKRISETHMFVYLPATVNGVPLTFNSLGELIKRYFPKNGAGYRHIGPSIIEQRGDISIGNSCWALMTNEQLPASGGKSSAVQQSMIANLATKGFPSYKVPRALDVAVCILARFANSEMRLFSESGIRCQDKVEVIYEDRLESFPVVVGGFSKEGFILHQNLFDAPTVCIAAMRKFTPFPTK